MFPHQYICIMKKKYIGNNMKIEPPKKKHLFD